MITASVVTYRTDSAELERCLGALQRSSVATVYVIDNASEQRVKDIAAGFSKAEYTANINSGYGAAHNIALRKAIGTGALYHLVLNTDVDFEPDAVELTAAYLERNADTGMVQPRIVGADGALLHSCRLLPTPFDLIIRRFLPDRLFVSRRKEYLLEHLDYSAEHNIPYHQGSFMTLRLKAVEQCGGFDERFFMYPEDIDLTRRIHRNWRTMYMPDASVTHFHRAGSYHSFRLLAVHVVNICRYFNKWGWWSDKERTRFNAPLRAKKNGAR